MRNGFWALSFLLLFSVTAHGQKAISKVRENAAQNGLEYKPVGGSVYKPAGSGAGGAVVDTTVLATKQYVTPKLNALTTTVAGLGSRYVYLFIVPGESNAAGYSLLSGGATNQEKAIEPNVKIATTTNPQFQSLQVGVNNYQGMRYIDNTRFGWELQLANRVRAGSFKDVPVYIAKCANGGATFLEWTKGGTFWNNMVALSDSCIAQIRTAGKIPLIVIPTELGGNDGINGKTAQQVKDAFIQYKNDLKTQYGNIPIVFLEFATTALGTFNVPIREVAAADPYIIMVSSAGLAVESDGVHFTYAAMKTGTDRIIDATLKYVGQREEYLVNGFSRRITSVVTTTATSGTTTGTSSYTDVVFNNTSNLATTTGLQSGTYYGYVASGVAGAVASTLAIDVTQNFEVVSRIDDAASGSIFVTYIDDSNATTYNPATALNVGGFFVQSSSLSKYEGTTVTAIGTITYPCDVRMSKSGNDLIYSWKANGASAWTTLSTSTGRLSGHTNTYIRLLSSSMSVGNKLKVSYSK